jgi:hypothetical protein
MNGNEGRFSRRAKIFALCTVFIAASETISTIAGPWLTYLYPPQSPDGLNPKFLGMWQEKYEYPDRNGLVGFEGTTQFFANKTYTVRGLLKITAFKSGSPSPDVVSYDFNGNGEWQATDDELLTKLLNVKTGLIGVSVAGQPIPVYPAVYAQSALKTELEQGLLLAQSQQYDIRSVKKNEITLETNGLHADSYIINMTRTKQMYLRQL